MVPAQQRFERDSDVRSPRSQKNELLGAQGGVVHINATRGIWAACLRACLKCGTNASIFRAKAVCGCSAGNESVAMFSAPFLDSDESDAVDQAPREAATSELPASVAICRQISVVATSEQPAGEQPAPERESVVSVHRTLVLKPSEAEEKPAEQPPRRPSSRKATIAFDVTAFQIPTQGDPVERSVASELSVVPAPVSVSDDKASAPAASGSAEAVIAPAFNALKALSGRSSATLLIATLLGMLLATTVVLLVRGNAEQPEHPRLLHLVVPR